jgi:Ran GTPase-activating protein (RanGAP) involved in mRNA processing and transport
LDGDAAADRVIDLLLHAGGGGDGTAAGGSSAAGSGGPAAEGNPPLELSEAGLGDDEAVAIASVLQSLSVEDTPPLVDLSVNDIGDRGAAALADAIASDAVGVRSWRIHGNARISAACRAKLARAAQKRVDQGLEPVKQLTVWTASDTVAFVGKLGAAVDLALTNRILNLTGTPVSEKDAETVAAAIAGQPELRTVAVADCGLTAEAATTVALGIADGASVSVFDASRNPALGGEGVSMLLDLQYQVDHVTRIAAKGCGVSAPLIDGIPRLLAGSAMDLHARSLTSEDAHIVAWLLRHHDTVDTCVLGGNALGDDGAEVIAPALAEASCLTTLDLRGNGIAERGAGAVARACVDAPSLRRLVLSQNRIGRPGVVAIKHAVASGAKLDAIELFGCSLGPDCVLDLVALIREPSSLTELSLADNGLAAVAATLQAASQVNGRIAIDGI